MSGFTFGSSVPFGSTTNTSNSFGTSNVFANTSNNLVSSSTMLSATGQNQFKAVEVVQPPEDTISALEFSPISVPQNYLVSGSWDNKVSCWEIQSIGNNLQSIPKAQQSHTEPVLDVAWSDDGTKVFSASCDKTVKMWDLNSNQSIQVAQHDLPVKTVHWIKAPSYQCIMTGSWDKSLKFWDTRQANPMLTIKLPERVYCADLIYPMAAVALANKQIIIYQLENQPTEYKRVESSLKFQSSCISIFCDKKNSPCGFALGSVEGRVSIQYVNSAQNQKDNFTFKCHRSTTVSNGYQDIYSVNDIKFHPIHGTLATTGSDSRYGFWNKDARTKLKTSDQLEAPITKCAFNARGEIFAYSIGYDWSKGHEYASQFKKNAIYIYPCFEELKPKNLKK